MLPHNRLPVKQMRFTFFLITVLLTLTVSGAYATEAVAPLTVSGYKALLPEEGSQELDLQGLLDLRKQGPVTILDVRSEARFARRHLRDSVNLPLTELTEKTLPAAAPDKNSPVVLACDYSFQPVRMIAMTMQAYPVLKAAGYKNIYRLNLWKGAADGSILTAEEIEKQLPFEGTETNQGRSPGQGGNAVVCTMDAKACPDGSYVSRRGPDCSFAHCAP